MWGTDLGPVPNLRRSNSSLCKKRGPQFLFNSSEKASGQWPAARRRVCLSPVAPGDHRGAFPAGQRLLPWGPQPRKALEERTGQDGSARFVPSPDPGDTQSLSVLGPGPHSQKAVTPTLCSDIPSSGQAPAQPRSWTTVTEGPGHDHGTGTLKRHRPLWRARGPLGPASRQHQGTPPLPPCPRRPQDGGAGVQTGAAQVQVASRTHAHTHALLRPESTPVCPLRGRTTPGCPGCARPPEFKSEQSPSELAGEGRVSREDGRLAWPRSSDHLEPTAEKPQLVDR